MYKLHTAAQTRDTAHRTPHTHHTFAPVDLTAPKVAAGKKCAVPHKRKRVYSVEKTGSYTISGTFQRK